MQVLGPARHVILHEGHADALGDAAMDLALHLGRIDGLAHVVRRGDAQGPDPSQLQVHLDLGDLGGEAVGGVRHALSRRVELGGRRIEAPPAAQHVAVRDLAQGRQVDAPHLGAVGDGDDACADLDCGIGAGIGEP